MGHLVHLHYGLDEQAHRETELNMKKTGHVISVKRIKAFYYLSLFSNLKLNVCHERPTSQSQLVSFICDVSTSPPQDSSFMYVRCARTEKAMGNTLKLAKLIVNKLGDFHSSRDVGRKLTCLRVWLR